MQSGATRRHRIAYDSRRPRCRDRCPRIPASRLPSAALLAGCTCAWRPWRRRATVHTCRPRSRQALARRKVPGTSLSVYVREVGREEPLVSYNSTVPRNPASTMKVADDFAALDTLGPAYTWRTRAYATGPIRDQVLEGNLVLVGGGDPFMTAERWWAFVAGLRQAGIQRIAGDVIIDNSVFRAAGGGPGGIRQPSVSHLQRASRRAAGQFPDGHHQRRAGRRDRVGARERQSLAGQPRARQLRAARPGRLPARLGRHRRGDARRADRQSHRAVGPLCRGLRAILGDARRHARAGFCVRTVPDALAAVRRHDRRRDAARRRCRPMRDCSTRTSR